jgi:prepilin-type N-terminal cleavage/methylation domain-containing protein
MTLIELLIAMTIMAIAVIPLVASLDYSRKATASTEKRGVDSAIGQAEMERIAAMK